MKEGVKALAIEDAPFDFSSKETFAVGVVMSARGILDKVAKARIRVDGNDSTDMIIRMFQEVKDPSVQYIFLNGVSLGGFNLVDIDKVSSQTKVPVMCFARGKPDLDAMMQVVAEKFPDSRQKMERVQALDPEESGVGQIYLNCSNISLDEAKSVMKHFTIKGDIPEPLRVAKMIAGVLPPVD